MAKTIKELALEAYPVKIVKTYGYLPCGNITEKDDNLLERKAMERGANAVLEEVERTISVSEDGWLESNLRKLINELKRLREE